MLATLISLLVSRLVVEAGATAVTAVDSDLQTLWAGHQVTYGTRAIPFQGQVTTRMESLVLARVRRDGDAMELSQEACLVRFDEVAGARVSMRARALPRSRSDFKASDDDAHWTGTSLVTWGSEDVDADGNPGMTVRVDAPVCSGQLYVSNRSSTRLRGAFGLRGFAGTATVSVHQSILGTRGACLGLVASDTHEVVRGPFAYVPVPPQTTCDSLLRTGWPVDAESKRTG